MDTDFGTIIIFFFLIFGVLEFTAVIIPAMLHRSRAKKSFEPEFSVPSVLSQPIPDNNIARMRSWYFDQNDPRRYLVCAVPCPAVPAGADLRSGVLPVSPERSPQKHPEPERDWKAINKATWAIQRANKAVREANYAILEANAIIQQADGEELEWMDGIAEMKQLRLPLER